MSDKGWIGVDLDGALAEYYGWKGITHIGKPIPKMIDRVKKWVSEGRNVRIVTARVSPFNGDEDRALAQVAICAWLVEHLGYALPITHEKDFMMNELWDDRCVQVIPNTGETAVREDTAVDLYLLVRDKCRDLIKEEDKSVAGDYTYNTAHMQGRAAAAREILTLLGAE